MIPRAVHHEWEKEWVAPDQRGSAFITRVCISTFSVFPDLPQNLPAFAECAPARMAATSDQTERSSHHLPFLAFMLSHCVPSYLAL